MIWSLCLCITGMLLLAALGLILWRKRGLMRFLYAVITLLLATFVIYIPPFFMQHGFVAAFFGNFFNTLQVLTLDAGYLDNYELISQMVSAPWLRQAYECVLAVLHILLPAVSAMTAVTLVVRCLTQLQLRRLRNARRDLHVFSCVNYESQILAADIRRNDARAELIFLETDNDMDHSDLRDSLICSVLEEKIENIRAKAKNRKVYYYCINQNQEENMDSALAILAALQEEPAQVQKNNNIFLFSRDPMAETMIDSLDKGLVEIDVINHYQAAAYQLLTDYPLTDIGQDQEIFVVLCGFSEMTLEMLRAVSWCGQLCGYRLKIRLLGSLSADAVAEFKEQYPGLFTDRYDIRFLDCPDQAQLRMQLENHCPNADYIIVAEQTEAQTIERAVFLRRYYYRQDPAFSANPRIYAYISNAEKAKAVESLCTAEVKPERRMSYGITPFGVATQMYTFANVTDSDLEKIAKNVHLMYEDIFADGPIDAQEAIRRYNLFEVNKRSNRANALHIRYKLFLLGLDYTDDPNAEEVDMSDYLQEALLEKLSQSEHDRWMAFLESEGWITATLEQAKAYQASGISKGRHNCPLLKMHPYICPFDELKGRSDALGLPDSTVYDRELISRIPEILHDKWGMTGKIYKIIQKQ